MKQRIPNILTIFRALLAIAFVAVMSLFEWPDNGQWALITGCVLFVIAAITDALDGFLARRWNAESVFGRIADPAADKVLVLGAFVLLASPGFHDQETGRMVSGMAAWMVVVILAREICVTTIRAVVERSGGDFGAIWTGKLKMILQSVGAPAIMLTILLGSEGVISRGTMSGINGVLAWAILSITAISGVDYAIRGVSALRAPPETGNP